MNITQEIIDYGLLSELAYLKLESNFFDDYSQDQKWTKDTIDLYFKNAAYEGKTGIDETRQDAMLDLLSKYTIIDFKSYPSGMQAMTLKDSSGKLIVSFRGTETAEWELFKDVESDAQMALGHETQQMLDAKSYMERLETEGFEDPNNSGTFLKADSSTTLTGHSLGGALAQYVAYKSGNSYETYTFNGFGIKKAEGIIGTAGDTSYIHNFHLGLDFVSGIGSVIGGAPGGELFEEVRKVLSYIPSSWMNKLNEAIISLGALATAAQINAVVDEYIGSFLGEVTDLIPYDSSNLLDYGTDHSIIGLNQSLALYFDYAQIFATDEIESINLDIASLSAVPFEDLTRTPYDVISENGLPKTLEYMGYALLGKTLTSGARYNELANDKTILAELKAVASQNNGVTIFTGLSQDEIASAAQGSKAILYTVVNNLPPVIVNNEGSSLYANFDGSYLSEEQIEDRAGMYYYMQHPKSGDASECVLYINEETEISVFSANAVTTDKIVFGSNSDEAETLQGLGGNDRIYGNGGDDTIIGGIDNPYILTDGDDYLEGGSGRDTLYGNGGNDILVGGYSKERTDTEADRLEGGEGYDTYFSGNGDTIMDSDGKGIVYFQEEHLSGGTIKAGASCDTTEFYYGDGGVYSYDKLSKQLTFTKNGTNETLSIENFTNTDLGITLSGAPACPTSTGDCPKPINPIFNFNFSLPTPSRPVTYGTGGGGSTYSGGGGGGGGGSSYTPHTSTPAPTPVIECVNSPVYHSTGTGGGGSSTGPIVLDLNRDGITSISIAASQALFDYDNDGVKENTAWIQSSDALLVNDKNSDGIINDATELFGNYTHNSDNSIAKSGYQALSYYDTNNDGVVNSTDTRFNELSLWIDSNQDGVTDTGELKTLSETGVTSITLNSATPYIPSSENTNTIIQETTFTDASGEGIMRDVLFRYENTSKPTDGVYFDMDGDGFKERTAWVENGDGLLVLDKNDNGTIDNGSELFGNFTQLADGNNADDGFSALLQHDENKDGKIDKNDAIYNQLNVWIDANQDGITDAGELKTLSQAGVASVNLNPYQSLMSYLDQNQDGVLNNQDEAFKYVLLREDDNGGVTLFIPQVDNQKAKLENKSWFFEMKNIDLKLEKEVA